MFYLIPKSVIEMLCVVAGDDEITFDPGDLIENIEEVRSFLLIMHNSIIKKKKKFCCWIIADTRDMDTQPMSL